MSGSIAMAPLPRNIRTKTPRPPSYRKPPVEAVSHTYRWGGSGTPTPPPVSVSTAPVAMPAPLPQPTQTKTSQRRRWVWMGAVLLLGVVSALGLRAQRSHTLETTAFALLPAAHAATAAAVSSNPPAKAVASSSGWKIKHDGHVPLNGGVLLLPETFQPDGDDYDLIIHFHGDVKTVLESVEHAKLNAALAVINLGVRSVPYRNAYQAPDRFTKLLAQIDRGLRRRGLPAPKLRRLALNSWSAGFGAVESILEHRATRPANADPLDALIALDGIHAGFIDQDPERLNALSIRSFVRVARAAQAGQLMFSMTHSEIVPPGFASAKRSQLHILEELGIELRRPAMMQAPPHLQLKAAAGAVKHGAEKRMVPVSDTRAGSLRVQGFRGKTKEHHAAHLTQMAAVALPGLAKRWAVKP